MYSHFLTSISTLTSHLGAIAKTSPFIMVAIVGIGFIIGFHEFGHFIIGRLCGLSFHTFSIGFGPKLISRKFLATDFTIALIPLGGYVEPVEGDHANPTPGTLAGTSYLKKMLVILGGITFNLIFSYLAFIYLFATGMPSNPFTAHNSSFIVQEFRTPESPAKRDGLQINDIVIKADGTDVNKKISALQKIIKEHPNKPLTLTILRDNQEKELVVTPRAHTVNNDTIGSLDVAFSFKALEPVSLIQSIKEAYLLTVSIVQSTALSFKNIFKTKSTDGLAGPLGMIATSSTMARHSFAQFLLLLAIISIGLAVLNVFPLPILDGGQVVSYTIEAIMGRPINEKTKMAIHVACWVFMLALTILLTIKDIKMLWSK